MAPRGGGPTRAGRGRRKGNTTSEPPVDEHAPIPEADITSSPPQIQSPPDEDNEQDDEASLVSNSRPSQEAQQAVEDEPLLDSSGFERDLYDDEESLPISEFQGGGMQRAPKVVVDPFPALVTVVVRDADRTDDPLLAQLWMTTQLSLSMSMPELRATLEDVWSQLRSGRKDSSRLRLVDTIQQAKLSPITSTETLSYAFTPLDTITEFNVTAVLMMLRAKQGDHCLWLNVLRDPPSLEPTRRGRHAAAATKAKGNTSIVAWTGPTVELQVANPPATSTQSKKPAGKQQGGAKKGVAGNVVQKSAGFASSTAASSAKENKRTSTGSEGPPSADSSPREKVIRGGGGRSGDNAGGAVKVVNGGGRGTDLAGFRRSVRLGAR